MSQEGANSTYKDGEPTRRLEPGAGALKEGRGEEWEGGCSFRL